MLAIGQLFVFGFLGTTLPPKAESLLTQLDASGVILFKRNIVDEDQVLQLNQHIMNLNLRHAPIIAVDQEGGRVARLKDICTFTPSARELGRLAQQDPQVVYRVAAMMGRELLALGFNFDFAPVADVDSNPNNPIIGDRSFSSDPKVCAELNAAFIKGLQDAGVAGSAKHFPGHGDTQADSHLELPIVDRSLEALLETELVPFEAAIHAKVASIMTAHILLPQIDPDYPATLSHKILTGILREKMGYQGLIVSDDLEMKGIADHYSLKEAIKLGLLAGVDLFLICHHPEKAQQAIEIVNSLIEANEVPRSRVEEAIARVSAFKAQFLGTPAAPSVAYANQIVGCEPHRELARLWKAQ